VSKLISIYPTDGGFVASVSGTWIKGFWPTFEEAAEAAGEAAAG